MAAKGAASSSNDYVEQLLLEMVAHMLSHEDFEALLTWMRDSAQRFFGHMDFVDEGGPRALAAMVARSAWNRMPLPGNHFKPRPVPTPGRNDPCPCNSGAKYKHCCAELPSFESFSADDIWTAVAIQLPAAQLRVAIETKRMPPIALAEAARRELLAGRPKRAVAVLQPMFEGDLAHCDERCEPALDVLCDAYQALGHDRKRLLFLERMTQHCRGPLAGAAWQRLAAMQMDRGDHGAAWRAFRGAQHADPDSPSLALNEITLLLDEGRAEEAAARARFYAARFRKMGLENEDWIASLDAVAQDPHRAIANMNMEASGVDVDRLRTWIDTAVTRPLARYEPAAVQEIDPQDENQTMDFFRSQLSALGMPTDEIARTASKMATQLKQEHLRRETSTGQQSLFSSRVEDPFGAQPNARVLAGHKELAELEAGWREVYPCDKPFGTTTGLTDGIDAWDPEAVEDWLGFLEAHPEAADSLEILDDLATALIAFDARLPQGAGFGLASALAERGAAMVVAAAGTGAVELPWLCWENRPGLRLIARVITGCLDRAEDERAAVWMRTLLGLNPNDNHGFRALLINHLLRTNDLDAALELIARYPDDRMVELAYGAILTYLRRGEENLAEQALQRALDCNENVPSYLIKERVTRPRMQAETLMAGGRDEAWAYREDARDVWVATPGALEWLRRATRGRH